MHTLNVLILGPSSFISTLNELKPFLKFNSITENLDENYNIILFHENVLKDRKQKELIEKASITKICAGIKRDGLKNFDDFLELPSTLKDINSIVENTAARKKFNINSSIQIKDYLLNKN
jgi:hypothetical protein